MNWKVLAVAALAIGSGLILRDMFPKTVQTPVVIHTVYDTVAKLDTVYVTKLKKETRWLTLYLEHLTTTKPETLYAVPSLNTLAFLHVPQTFTGDSMFAKGFAMR